MYTIFWELVKINLHIIFMEAIKSEIYNYKYTPLGSESVRALESETSMIIFRFWNIESMQSQHKVSGESIATLEWKMRSKKFHARFTSGGAVNLMKHGTLCNVKIGSTTWPHTRPTTWSTTWPVTWPTTWRLNNCDCANNTFAYCLTYFFIIENYYDVLTIEWVWRKYIR